MEKKKSKLKKLIGNVICVILIVAMTALVVFLLVGRSENRVTFLFSRAVVWILSPSMEETIPARSYILVKKVDPAEVQIGDVIMFYSDDPNLSGSLNTHRVVEVHGDHQEFVTKGDSNAVKDVYTAKSDKVVGVYVKNLPGITAFMRFFLTKIGIISLIVVFAGLTVALYVPEMLTHKKSKKQKEVQRLMGIEIDKLKKDDIQKNNNEGDRES